ncbi:hypothetical protein BDN71DRAFT_1399578 [Pleurotus eryngii]|uniref:Uncharacterized protein n=1 Tax=Pleurotus eryngii TaxID=5323 RepID=A0A9P5ZM83_PLEER|nr:hypothetical protein BDN71DRAFT_1399578 [Pleurotus eryngii]
MEARCKAELSTLICEQANVWFGSYMAILRNMEVTRYNFYLDEMIKRRNQYVLQDLEAKGRTPWVVPVDVVFPNTDI